MSKTTQTDQPKEDVDNFTSEEIQAVKDFHASDEGKMRFKTYEEAKKWLDEP